MGFIGVFCSPRKSSGVVITGKMLQKSHSQPPFDVKKNVVNNANLPTLNWCIPDFFHQLTVSPPDWRKLWRLSAPRKFILSRGWKTGPEKRGGETPRRQGVWKWVQICAENGIKLEWEKKRIRQNPNKMWFKYSSIYFRTVKIIQPKQC